ncbi:hypothetical protein RRG08_015721 [Elysia crispata]|uniref:Uncharacterized protein n=1 Tax=Elysia crispata TaxID=231223 RepID=A0AAE0Z5B0_9GAST|nr:hypothetical protein RRG08_015721 [Elysia crispata]
MTGISRRWAVENFMNAVFDDLFFSQKLNVINWDDSHTAVSHGLERSLAHKRHLSREMETVSVDVFLTSRSRWDHDWLESVTTACFVTVLNPGSRGRTPAPRPARVFSSWFELLYSGRIC